MAFDTSGDTLRDALAKIDLAPSTNNDAEPDEDSVRLKTPKPYQVRGWNQYNLNGGVNGKAISPGGSGGSQSPISLAPTPDERGSGLEEDYFSARDDS